MLQYQRKKKFRNVLTSINSEIKAKLLKCKESEDFSKHLKININYKLKKFYNKT